MQGKRKDTGINYQAFHNIQYVLAADLDSELIEVDIRRDDGSPVAFNMESNYKSASKVFWQTIRRLRGKR